MGPIYVSCEAVDRLPEAPKGLLLSWFSEAAVAAETSRAEVAAMRQSALREARMRDATRAFKFKGMVKVRPQVYSKIRKSAAKVISRCFK